MTAANGRQLGEVCPSGVNGTNGHLNGSAAANGAARKQQPFNGNAGHANSGTAVSAIQLRRGLRRVIPVPEW